MLKTILYFHDLANEALDHGVYLKEIEKMDIRPRITRMRYISEDDLDQVKNLSKEMKEEFAALVAAREVQDA